MSTFFVFCFFEVFYAILEQTAEGWQYVTLEWRLRSYLVTFDSNMFCHLLFVSCSTICAFILLYIVYDFFYTIGHRALHHRSVYKYVHKHHHRQRAPSRGNVDAVNVHPFEFVSGEYNHLFRYANGSFCSGCVVLREGRGRNALASWLFLLIAAVFFYLYAACSSSLHFCATCMLLPSFALLSAAAFLHLWIIHATM